MDLAESPLTGLQSEDELESYPWPSPDDWDFSPIPGQIENIQQYWVWAHSRGIFEISWFIRGFNEFMMDLAMNPCLANALMDKVQAFLMECTKRTLNAGGGKIDMMEYNDDVAGQNGMLVSPGMWREFVKPRMANFIKMCRENYGVKIMYHCCGGLRPIIGDLIEIGVDVLNPVQPIAAGMELQALKRDFGSGITFNGGVDTQDLLPYATPDEVRREVRKIIDVVGKDGGYILAPSHVFQGDVPVDNILAMYSEGLGKQI